MKNRYLHTLIALAVLAGLWGAFVYIGRKKSHRTSKSKTPPEQKIFTAGRDHIRSFTLKPREGQPVTCVWTGKTWQITEPQKLATDSSSVDGFLNSFTDAVPDETIEEHPTNLRDYGLDPPRESVEVTSDAEPEKFTLLLGDSTPTNGGIYAQIVGKPRVFTLASYMKDALEKSLFNLRNKQVVTFKSDQISRIEVASKKGQYTLVKNPEGVWDLVLPPAVRADHFTVEGLVNELGSASMKSIVAEGKKNLGKYGFSNPALTLHLSGPDGSQTLLLGGKHGDAYYAVNTAEAPVFTLGSDFLTQFQKDSASLRSKDLFTFSTFDAKKITVDGRGGHWVFVRNKGKWNQTEPQKKAEPDEKMQTLIDDLRDLSAASFPKRNPTHLAAFGLNKPAYTLEVQYGDQNKTQTVEMAKVGAHVYARRSTDVVASEVSKDSLDTIQKDLGAL